MRKITAIWIGLAAAAALASQANAGITTFTGADNNVSSLADMTNSVAASNAFNAAAPGLGTIDFESAIPSGVTITGGGSITNNSGCGPLCGFNTTSGGQNFLELVATTATFTFATPINAFGLYVTGLQTDIVPTETLTFQDGSTETIDTPPATNGGGAFIGFTDLGKGVTSVTYDSTDDYVALDDVKYGSISAAPEPASWALMFAGVGGIGLMLRRSRKQGFSAAAAA